MLPTRRIDTRPASELIDSFDLACKRAGLTHDQVAGMLGIKEQQMHQQLKLLGHFSLTRLVRLRDEPLGRKFLREYWPLVAHDMGISEVADALQIADAFGVFVDTLQRRMLSGRRMARAELRAAVEAERKRA